MHTRMHTHIHTHMHTHHPPRQGGARLQGRKVIWMFTARQTLLRRLMNNFPHPLGVWGPAPAFVIESKVFSMRQYVGTALETCLHRNLRSVCVCMCAYMCACVCVRACAWMCACVCMCARGCVAVAVDTRMCVHDCVRDARVRGWTRSIGNSWCRWSQWR